METRFIKRYNAYYRGWCVAFGEHQSTYDETKDINWLFADDRVGLIISSNLRKRLLRELLGHHDEIPELKLSNGAVCINELVHEILSKEDQIRMRFFNEFLLESKESHMFLCSHFCYPAGTRIITFAKKKPLIIMYKEMQPLTVSIEK